MIEYCSYYRYKGVPLSNILIIRVMITLVVSTSNNIFNFKLPNFTNMKSDFILLLFEHFSEAISI